jgi:hypothetical protein
MTLHHVLLAKEYMERASTDLRTHSTFGPGFAVSAMQDAVEIMLFAAANQLHANPGKDFEGLWSSVNAKLAAERQLPYRAQLVALNKARVAFKHYGTVPDFDEATRMGAAASAFLTEASLSVLNLDLASVSQVDLLTAEPVKGYLVAAMEALNRGDLEGALQRCADARAAIRDQEEPLYSEGISVQFNNVPSEIRQEINLQIGNLRRQMWRVRDLALGSLFGLNLVDVQIMESIVPEKRGGEYVLAQPRVFQLQPKNVQRCIQVLVGYGLAVEKYWVAGRHPDWVPI